MNHNTHCPRCGGRDGAHYAACVFTNMIQRWLGTDYPLFGPQPVSDGLSEEAIADIGQQYMAGAKEGMYRDFVSIATDAARPLREQIETLRRELDAAMEIITAPKPDAVIRREQDPDANPAPEPERRPLDVNWPFRVKTIRESRGWTQGELAAAIGSSRSLIGLWETGTSGVGRKYKDKLIELENNPPQNTQPKKTLPPELVAANQQAVEKATAALKTALEAATEPDPEAWLSGPTILRIARAVDPEMTPRLVGLGLNALGYTEKRQIRLSDKTAPVHYRGLKLRNSSEPPKEPPLADQMEQRREAEAAAQAELPPPAPAKERYRYDGPRPGGEIYPEYRELLKPLWSVPGWSYAPRNPNGGGKPRVTNPQGTSYVIPNTPSDVRGIKNVRAALRRLGAPI